MRPVPQSKHVLVAVLFIAVASGAAYLAAHDPYLSDEQISFATAAEKQADDDLFAYDSVYGEVNCDGELARLHTPIFLALMDMLRPPGQDDPTLPFRLMTGFVVLLYLAGMYAVLWRQCHSSSIAAFVAILSTTITPTFGGWGWGVGSLASITPGGIVLACSPLILLSYLRNSKRRQIALTFFAIGLLANLHLITAANLAAVMLFVHLGRSRLSLRGILTTLSAAGAFLVGALPYLYYFFSLRASLSAGAPDHILMSAGVVNEALRLSDINVLYPEMLESLFRWAGYSALLILPSLLVMWRVDRFQARDAETWLWMLAAGLTIGLGFHAVSQAVGGLMGKAPPLIDLVQATVWVMPALYAMFAQALLHLFRIAEKRHRHALRWAMAVLMIAWMLPAENFRYARHQGYRLSTLPLGEDDRPIRVQELAADRRERAELHTIAAWTRENTPLDAVVLTNQAVFRMQARRSLLACREDIRHFYYLAPWLLEEWMYNVQQQYRWIHPPMDLPAMLHNLQHLRTEGTLLDEPAPRPADAYRDVPAWYILLPAHALSEPHPALEEIRSTQWQGDFWRLYRILLPATPAMTPSTTSTRPGG